MTTEQIKGTPFSIVYNEQENKFYVVIGNYAIYQNENVEECRNAVYGKSWELLFNFCTMITEQTLKQKQNETERKS